MLAQQPVFHPITNYTKQTKPMTESSSITILSSSELKSWLHKKKKKKKHFPSTSSSKSSSKGFVLILDVHVPWTGRCETMIPQMDTLYTSIIPDSQKKWKYCSVCMEECCVSNKSDNKKDDDSDVSGNADKKEVDKSDGGDESLSTSLKSVLLKELEIAANCIYSNCLSPPPPSSSSSPSSSLSSKGNDIHINAASSTPDEEDEEMNAKQMKSILKKQNCYPLFLVVKNCQVIAIVQGANFPLLSKVIHDNVVVSRNEDANDNDDADGESEEETDGDYDDEDNDKNDMQVVTVH